MWSLILKISKVIPDSYYLKLLFYKNMGYPLNFSQPIRFNEKIQWLKLHDRKPEYSTMVDKYRVRKLIEEKIGEKYLVPLIGAWENASQIDFSKLPEQFVLKCNHDSKSVIICKNKCDLNIPKTVHTLNKRLKRNAYWYGREWPYKNVKPCIIAETYLVDPMNHSLNDYKVLCFNGKAKFIQVHKNRGTENYTQDFYDIDWNMLDICQGVKVSKTPLERPDFLDEMICLSEILAKGLIHIRVDWYYAQGQLYFGELTFYDGSGFVPFKNKEDDIMLGNLIDVEKIAGIKI